MQMMLPILNLCNMQRQYETLPGQSIAMSVQCLVISRIFAMTSIEITTKASNIVTMQQFTVF
jgi:hypothetical protein